MDNSQTSYDQQQYQPYSFDLDMMKRSIESAGGSESKKARWSPNSTGNYAVTNGGGSPAGATNTTTISRDTFANYGYGGAQTSQNNFNNSPSSGAGLGFGAVNNNASALYNPPSLALNTQVNAVQSQHSPNPGSPYLSQLSQLPQHVQSPQNAMANYSMLGMGIPGMAAMGMYNGQVANFAQQRLPSLNLNIPSVQSPYSPASLSALMSATSNGANRTVYVGNLPATASVDELLNLVHFGPLESIRVLPEKSCVFLSFLDGQTASAFHADATIKKLNLHSQELKVGWGKPSPVPAQVQLAITQSNASRNVYLGGLEETTTEEALRDDLSRFGLIDQVKIVRDKNIGFVHFLSISVATKVVNTLPTEPAWAGKRVNYGKDRCAYIPKSQQVAAQQAQAAAAQSLVAQSSMGGLSPNVAFSPYTPFSPFSPAEALAMGSTQALNRTAYLGNIHPETTLEDLCNTIRGGVLQSIRYMPDKHIAFVTFVDPAAAFTFYQVASFQGLTLNNRKLKVGWGKNPGALPPTLALAVHSGATRNVYIGNVEDFDAFGEERLRRDFGEYGEIELVNFLKEKNCAFVNFTNIANAIKAIDAVKNKPEYANLRIAHGKDRCANPPRSGPQGASGSTSVGGARRSASGLGPGGGPNSAEPGSAGEEGGEGPFEADPAVLEMELDGAEKETGIVDDEMGGHVKSPLTQVVNGAGSVSGVEVAVS